MFSNDPEFERQFFIDQRQFYLLLAELQEIRSSQHAVLTAVAAIHQQGVDLMAASQELQTALASIDTATTAVGDRIAALAQQITTDMSPAEVATVVQQLNADAAKLTSIAADPNNPVPTT